MIWNIGPKRVELLLGILHVLELALSDLDALVTETHEVARLGVGLVGGGPDLGVAREATVWAKTVDDAVGFREIPAAIDSRFGGLDEILFVALLLGLAPDAVNVLRHHPTDGALLRILLRLLGFELRPVSSFSSTTFALLIYHEDGHGAVGLGLFLGISALDVAPMVAHPVDDVAHLVGGQALKILLGNLEDLVLDAVIDGVLGRQVGLAQNGIILARQRALLPDGLDLLADEILAPSQLAADVTILALAVTMQGLSNRSATLTATEGADLGISKRAFSPSHSALSSAPLIAPSAPPGPANLARGVTKSIVNSVAGPSSALGGVTRGVVGALGGACDIADSL
ncbi:hypothetical protein PG999_005623 [Apiospora kogelbergensis]|uniref:Uncharacterized protein n=1 Tax=Apiospora kogelbergensis TaxID=1337665 RepID=A0AAW0R2Q7_9PEZI